jgi:hypothetical protein
MDRHDSLQALLPQTFRENSVDDITFIRTFLRVEETPLVI